MAEKTFAVNHLAPFILTHLLLDLVRAAPAGRILTASSGFHSGGLDFSNLQESSNTTGWGPTSARSFATFCLPTNCPGASRERRLLRTVLAPDPPLHAWATTCEVYMRHFPGC